jgi:hypothetical protein
MLGLALRTIRLLVWNAWWVRKRGHFGRGRARSLYPIVLGLGRCLSALITTIVGAAAVRNLRLALDITRIGRLGISRLW